MSHSFLVGLVVFAASILSVLGTGSNEAQAGESAVSQTVADAGLDWGPCPDFMPTGCGIAVLHGDPSKPNVDVFFRIPGEHDLPAHWHTSAERMVLVAGELHVTYDGQATSKLKTGMYAYGPPALPHSGRCVSREACVLFIAFESPLDAIAVVGKKK